MLLSAMTSALTVQLEEETIRALDRLAEETDRTRDALISEALHGYLASEAAQLAEIAEAIAQADRSEFVSDEEVERILTKYDPPR
jgi:predicted transcriptional regulator